MAILPVAARGPAVVALAPVAAVEHGLAEAIDPISAIYRHLADGPARVPVRALAVAISRVAAHVRVAVADPVETLVVAAGPVETSPVVDDLPPVNSTTFWDSPDLVAEVPAGSIAQARGRVVAVGPAAVTRPTTSCTTAPQRGRAADPTSEILLVIDPDAPVAVTVSALVVPAKEAEASAPTAPAKVAAEFVQTDPVKVVVVGDPIALAKVVGAFVLIDLARVAEETALIGPAVAAIVRAVPVRVAKGLVPIVQVAAEIVLIDQAVVVMTVRVVQATTRAPTDPVREVAVSSGAPATEIVRTAQVKAAVDNNGDRATTIGATTVPIASTIGISGTTGGATITLKSTTIGTTIGTATGTGTTAIGGIVSRTIAGDTQLTSTTGVRLPGRR